MPFIEDQVVSVHTNYIYLSILIWGCAFQSSALMVLMVTVVVVVARMGGDGWW